MLSVRMEFKDKIIPLGITFESGDYSGESTEHYIAEDIEAAIDREARAYYGYASGVTLRSERLKFFDKARNAEHFIARWSVADKTEDQKLLGSLCLMYICQLRESAFEISRYGRPRHLRYSVKLAHTVDAWIEFADDISLTDCRPDDIADPLFLLSGLAALGQAVIELIDDHYVIVQPSRYE